MKIKVTTKESNKLEIPKLTQKQERLICRIIKSKASTVSELVSELKKQGEEVSINNIEKWLTYNCLDGSIKVKK